MRRRDFFRRTLGALAAAIGYQTTTLGTATGPTTFPVGGLALHPDAFALVMRPIAVSIDQIYGGVAFEWNEVVEAEPTGSFLQYLDREKALCR